MLKVQASASWTGPPGACDDGLGQSDPMHSSYAGPTLVSQTQSGTAYVVVQVQAGGTVPYSVTPTSSATSSNCSVSASVTLTPVYIASDYAVLTETAFNFLVGQQADFYVSAGNYNVTLVNNWSIGGDHVSGVALGGEGTNPTFDETYYDTRTTDQSFDGSVAHPSVYFEGDDDDVQVSVSVALSTASKTIGTVNLSQDVEVYAPATHTMGLYPNRTVGPCTIYDADPTMSTDAEAAMAQDYSSPGSGFWLTGAITLPELFTNAQGDGEWSYVQLCNREYQYDDVAQPDQTEGLDNTYPYGGYVHGTSTPVEWSTTAGAGLLDFYDAPSIPISGHNEYQYFFHGDCFTVLRPPVSNGQGSVDLPICLLSWDYTSSSTRNTDDEWDQESAYRQFSNSTYGSGWVTTPTAASLDPGSAQYPVDSYQMDWNQANMNGSP